MKFNSRGMIRIRMPAIKATTGPKENERVTAANQVKFSIDLSYLKIALLLPDGRLLHKSGHQFIGLAHLQKYDDALLALEKCATVKTAARSCTSGSLWE
jgi:hypothetical protein